MLKKLIGIFICTLMIVSVILPLTGAENVKTKSYVNLNNYSKLYQNTPANPLSLITIKFEGKVTNVNDPGNTLGGKIKVDEIITGKYIYNTWTKDSDSSTERGLYQYTSSPYGIEVNASGLIFKTDPNFVEFNIEIINNGPDDSDWYSLTSIHNLPLSDTVSIDGIYWILFNESGTAFSSDALPTTALVLSSWDDSFGFTISGSSSEPNPSDFHITIHITKVTKNRSIDEQGTAKIKNDDTTFDNDIINPMMSDTVRIILIGLIKNPEISENMCEFDPILVLFFMNMGVNGIELDILTKESGPYRIEWASKNGFIGNNFICGRFILDV